MFTVFSGFINARFYDFFQDLYSQFSDTDLAAFLDIVPFPTLDAVDRELLEADISLRRSRKQ